VTTLFHHRLVHEHDCRQVGGWPPTSRTQPLAELLDPLPDRHVRPLDADPAQHLCDQTKAHAAIVQKDRHLDDVAIRPLALEKLDLVQHLV